MSKKRVLLVVRAHNPQDPKRQLEWLEQNIFPAEEFRQRTLVYIGSVAHLRKMDEPWLYDHFNDVQDVYSKLRGEGFFDNTYREQRHFDVAVFMHIRRDRASGMGYGLEECRGERCILRAIFLAARGNVLFGDWGLPLGTKADVTREQLLARRKMHQHVYPAVHRRRYPDLTANVPFTKVIDHFLTPVEEKDPGLPDGHLHRIRQATEGTLFTECQLSLAVWNAWWHLYFWSDEYVMIYHRWIHFRFLQQAIFDLVDYFRAWAVSSTWLEIAIDTTGFLCMAIVYGILSRASDYPEPIDLLSMTLAVEALSSIVEYSVGTVLATILFNVDLMHPDDRVPVWTKMQGFMHYSIGLAFARGVLHFWWHRTQAHLAEVLMLQIILALIDLMSKWFLVPLQRNCVSFTGQVLAFAVFSLGMPRHTSWLTVQQHSSIASVAWVLLEQPLYGLPLFAWGRLRLHPQLKRSLVLAPWGVTGYMMMAHSLTQSSFALIAASTLTAVLTIATLLSLTMDQFSLGEKVTKYLVERVWSVPCSVYSQDCPSKPIDGATHALT